MKMVFTVFAIIAIAFTIGISSFESDTDLNYETIGLDPGGAILTWEQPEKWPTEKWTLQMYEPANNEK